MKIEKLIRDRVELFYAPNAQSVIVYGFLKTVVTLCPIELLSSVGFVKIAVRALIPNSTVQENQQSISETAATHPKDDC